MTTKVPALGQMGAARLPAGALAYMNVRALCELAAAALLLGGAAWWFLDGSEQIVAYLAITALGLVAVTVELPWLNRRRYAFTTYSVDDNFVYITRGAIFRRSVLLPKRQILNVETIQGPLLRQFGFANVRFSCITEVESLGPLDNDAIMAIRAAVAIEPESASER